MLTSSPLHHQPSNKSWKFLGQGSYNTTYRSHCGQFVLKVPIPKGEWTEDAERSLKLFAEIHPEYAEKTALVQVGNELAWIMPYFEGEEASDCQIAQKLIDIYQRTGRVVVDAPSRDNFLYTRQGQIVCIDVGCAFRLKSYRNRAKSIGSTYLWDQLEYRYRKSYFQKPNFQRSHSFTLNIIKSLLLLQEYTIEVEKYDFLYQYPRFSAFLAKLYDMHQIIPAKNMQKYIRLVNDYTLENMKKRYLKILSNYLIQRCYRDIHLQLFLNSPCKPQPLLQLSWLSFLFQKHTLTHQKIRQVQSNMIEIYHCQDIPFLITYILQLRDPEDEIRGRCYPSQLQKVYDQCQIDILCSKNLLNYL